MRIAIDTGGTFTDCVYLNADGLQVLKVASTPADPGEAIVRAVSQIAADGAAGEVRHGTTVGTNALLERKGARVAFVTTKGFEDTIAIGRQARPKLYDLFFQKPQPLAGEGARFGVAERVAADGSILLAVDAAELERLKLAVAAFGPESIALSLLFAFANSANEKAVCAALRELGVPVSASHEILPEFREYERGSTVLINAYLAPKMQSYLKPLNSRLQARGMEFQVMQSSGGIVPAGLAAREPVRTILSGPAGGVVGAMAVAREAGFSRALTFDMGGTSTDVALVDCEAGLQTSTESQIEGMPVAIPVLNIHTVGAGGGSLASFDRGGALKVGPESAGAVPGPVCYGRGEQPTVTDANLVLGRLDLNGLLGGGMKLDVARTRDRMAVCKQALASVEIFAEGIIALANSHMAQALRKISVEQGHDPRDFILVSFGGAGPLHACDLARALRIPKVLVPNMPGALSAYGILLSDVVRDYSRTVMLRPDDAALERQFVELEDSADFQGVAERSADLRYAGQGYELRVPYGRDFVERFHAMHKQKYGYADAMRSVEVVNIRLRMTAKTEKPVTRRSVARPGDGSSAVVRESELFCDGAWHAARIYERGKLQAGDVFSGPAVIAEYSATTYMPPGTTATVDEFLNLVIEVGTENRLSVSETTGTRTQVSATRDGLCGVGLWGGNCGRVPGFALVDPIELAIFKSGFHSIAEEMGAALRRTAFSPNIKERRDYSSALFDADGQVIAMGDDMPVHLGSMPMSVRAALDKLTLAEGDIAMLNDPYAGGTHLPDITLVIPVFVPQSPRAAFYAANRAHHADVGGMYPGSMGLCREIWQEGIRIPPVKLVAGGVLNDALLQLILNNVRTPREREGDLTAQIGACRIGAERLREMVEKYGLARVGQNAQSLMQHSEELMRSELALLPEGEFSAEDYLDSDGLNAEPVKICVTLRTNPVERTLQVDFTGSAGQIATSLNAVAAITYSATFYVLRCLLPEEAAATAGLMRPVELVLPEGSVVNARLPAAVAGGNVETSQRITDVLLRAFAKMLPARIPAASSGTMNNLTIGGIDPRNGQAYAYYETIAGGSGGRPNGDGVPGVHTHMTNSLNTPVEALEYAYPFRVRRYGYRRGSGGAGKFCGGDGLVREIELLGAAQVTILADRRVFAPYGLQGGADGMLGRSVLVSDGRERELPGKCNLAAGCGDVVRVETPGGGGWG